MQPEADPGETEKEPLDPESEKNRLASASGGQDESGTRQSAHEESSDANLGVPTGSNAADPNLPQAQSTPIKIQSAQADTGPFRRALAGLFGIEVEGLSEDIDDQVPDEEDQPGTKAAVQGETTQPAERLQDSEPEAGQSVKEDHHEEVAPESPSSSHYPLFDDTDPDYILANKIREATAITAASRESSIPRQRSRLFSRERISGWCFSGMEFLQPYGNWVILATALLVVGAFSLLIAVTYRDGKVSSPEIEAPPKPTATGISDSANNDGASPKNSREEGLGPGADFTGAYLLSVENISSERSILQIRVPAGVEGRYKATVTISEELQFECTFLHHYVDRLYCVGSLLPPASPINIRIFKIDEVSGSSALVFETNYTTGELAPNPTPSPSFPVYGGAFTWPDRFDGMEADRGGQGLISPGPLSLMFGVVPLLALRILLSAMSWRTQLSGSRPAKRLFEVSPRSG